MAADVAYDFPFVDRAGIANGKPVRGGQWAACGRSLNWLLGHGNILIPATRVEVGSVAAGETRSLEVQLWTTPQARYRVWYLRLQTTVGSGAATWTFTDPSGGTISGTLYGDTDRSAGITHVETITGAFLLGPVAKTVTLSNDASSTIGVTLEAMSCWEVPRDRIAADGVQYGADVDTIAAGLPIFDDVGLSIGGVIRGVPVAQSQGRRVLFAHLRLNKYETVVSATSFTDLFDEGPVCQPSHQFHKETLRPCDVYVYGFVPSGATGEVRFTAASGDTLTLTMTSTTGAWVNGTIDLYAEDLSTSDGRRALTDEIVTIAARRVSGSGSISIASIFIAERRD